MAESMDVSDDRYRVYYNAFGDIQKKDYLLTQEFPWGNMGRGGSSGGGTVVYLDYIRNID